MKKLLTNNIFLAIFICALIAACSKDFDPIIDDSFDFLFSEEHSQDGFIYEGIETNFLVQPEKKISTVDYFTSYEVAQGNGIYISIEGDTIKPGTEISLSELKWLYNYVAKDTGTHKIKFNAWDSNGTEKTMNITYNVVYAPFTFIMNKGDKDFIINAQNILDLTLSRDSETSTPEDKKGTFKVSYQVENGSGNIFYNDNTYKRGEVMTLTEGTTSLKYIPTTLGEHTIIATATAPDGATRSVELKVNIRHLEFTANVTAEAVQTELNTDVKLNYELTNENKESDVAYQFTYSYSENSKGSATITDANGVELNAGDYYDISLGSHDFNFNSDDLGRKKIFYTTKDSNGQIKKDSIEINVSNVPFVFTGSPERKVVFLNQKTPINYSLTANGNTEKIDYSYFFEVLDGNGNMVDSGNKQITSSSAYNVGLGEFTLYYTPTTLDAHQIKSWVVDSYGQASEPIIIELTAKHLDLTFKVSEDNPEVKVGEEALLSLSLLEKEKYEGVTFELSHVISGGTAELNDNGTPLSQSDYKEVKPGSWKYGFIATAPGTYEVAFLLRDSNGQIIDDQVATIIVKKNDFTVDAKATPTTEYVNKEVTVVLDIKEIPSDAGETFEGYYTSDKLGKLTIGDKAYTPGTKFPLAAGINILKYTGLEKDAHSVIYNIKSSAGYSHQAETVITFKEIDFTFTGNISKNEISVGETANITMNINESEGTSTYKGRFTMNGTAIVKDHNGNVITSGDIVDIPTGSFTWTVEGAAANDVSMTIYAKNDSGKENPLPINFSVKPKNYTFSSTPSRSNAFTNETVDVLLNIEEIGAGGDTYTVYYSTSNSGYITFNGTTYNPGEKFNVPAGNSTVVYTSLSDQNGTHNIEFNALSSSGVAKNDIATINFEKFLEPFTLNVSQGSGDKKEGEPFTLNVITNASSGHNAMVDYQLAFTFSGVTGGTIKYNGQTYSTGQNIPIDYGAISMEFTPTTDEDFTINFNGTNSTGQSASTTTSVVIVKKPIVFTKGEKHNVSCGGFNGCDYESRVYICWSEACSKTFDGAIIQSIHVSVKNSSTGNYENHTFSPGDAYGNDGDRFFILEKFGKESSLNYKNQPYDIYIIDSNGNKSDTKSGRIAG